MVADSSKPKPVIITSSQQQAMLHAETIAEFGAHLGANGKLVRMFGKRPDFFYELTGSGLETFTVWVDREKCEVQICICCPPVTPKKSKSTSAHN